MSTTEPELPSLPPEQRDLVAGLRAGCEVVESFASLVVSMVRDPGQTEAQAALREAVAASLVRLHHTVGLLEACQQPRQQPVDGLPDEVLGLPSSDADPIPPLTAGMLPGDVERKCVLSANEPGFSAPGVLEFLCRGAKTGTLVLGTNEDRFALDFVDGELAHAISEFRPSDEHLSALLLSRGLDAAVVEGVAALCDRYQDPAGSSLGGALESAELLDPEVLGAALEDQAMALFARLCRAEGQWFEFYEGVPALPEKQVCLNVTKLLLDHARVEHANSA
ncbi:MAG: DUF4388 domain-containing protein [Planctomycetota bacterium]